ncbi:MAG: TolC family protein [Thermoanaerobaculia bacterium]
MPLVAAEDSVQVSAELPDLSGSPALNIEDGTIKLSLEEAKAIALERNLTLVVERFSQHEADYRILQNRGVYDAFSTVDLDSMEDTSPTASNLSGAPVQEFSQKNWNFGISQLVATGGTLRGDWRNRKQETNSLFATLNPSYQIDTDVTFSQPLLRNLGKMATNRNITIARTNYSISRENFERQVTGILLLVEEAYWNLAEAEAQLGVAEESLELALQLHEQNKIRVEVGTLAPLELVQSEAGVANRELEIIRAQARVGDRMDVLRQLLNLKSDLEWTAPIDPTTDPFLPALKVNVDASIATALEERPEVRAKKLSLSNQELDTRYFRNQKKPRLDLTATYGLNGLGGDVTDRDFLSGEILGTQDGDYGDAIDQILNADFDGWRVALNFAYPIQNRFAKANVAIADLALERGMYELDDLELAVSTEVRRVIRALDASAEGIESARVSQRLEERNYEAEKKRYDNGMSTSFQVLQIQEDLIGARSVFVSAVATYRRALALHYQSIGRLIDESGVEIVGE